MSVRRTSGEIELEIGGSEWQHRVSTSMVPMLHGGEFEMQKSWH